MSSFTARFERLELKYLIDEFTARDLRAQIAPYCVPDKHCQRPATDRDGYAGYSINSLYLDTPGLGFHRAKERGDPERVKLRVRTYSESSPATLEIKRRRRDVIDKTRGVVDRDKVEDIAHGMPWDPMNVSFFNDFGGVVATAGAAPTLTVNYEREAYESLVDDYARVTFDRKIRVQRTGDWNLMPDPNAWCRFDDHWNNDFTTTPVVLEIKCQTASLPCWIIDLIRDNALRQRSFSKYSIGIHLTGRADGAQISRSRSARALE